MCFHYLRYISKYKQDQETRDPWKLVKLQCSKKYYNFHFFHRQDFLLFETLSFPCCVHLPCCFLTMWVIFSKSNSTKGTGKTAENPFCIGLVPEWHKSSMPSSIATLAGKQLGIFCSRNSFQVLNSTSCLFFFFSSPSLHLTTKARKEMWFPSSSVDVAVTVHEHTQHQHRTEQIAVWQPTNQIPNYPKDDP